MGLSSNQARFLSLTSRQVDMEQRIQQICQRRLRLSSELENVATQYNNSISNRKMFAASQTNQGINSLTSGNLQKLGYKVINALTKTEAAKSMKPIAQMSETQALSNGYVTIHNATELVTALNSGSTTGKTYVLQGNIDLSELSPMFSKAVITNQFDGTFDGNGYTISNMNINTGGVAGVDNIGFFSMMSSTAVVKNVAIENSTINATASSNVGLLVGENIGGKIDNCYSTGYVDGGSAGVGSAYSGAGGLAGITSSSSTISNSYSTADVNGNFCDGGLVGIIANSTVSNSFATGNVTSNDRFTGGLAGADWGSSTIDQSYSTGNVKITSASGGDAGGLVGNVNVSAGYKITNSYSASNVTNAGYNAGGLVGASNNVTIENSYATGNVSTAYGVTGGILARDYGGNSGSNIYYQNNLSSDAIGATKGIPATGWNTNWDTLTTPPTLKNTALQGSISADKLEEGLRNGVYSLAREADEFTQDPITLNGKQYEEADWRTVPQIYDELYKGDDVDAENKYDKTVSEINAQDKKLQLEQTSVEVEYKAVTSEKEAVKKILDTNAQSSFKYFS